MCNGHLGYLSPMRYGINQDSSRVSVFLPCSVVVVWLVGVVVSMGILPTWISLSGTSRVPALALRVQGLMM